MQWLMVIPQCLMHGVRVDALRGLTHLQANFSPDWISKGSACDLPSPSSSAPPGRACHRCTHTSSGLLRRTAHCGELQRPWSFLSPAARTTQSMPCQPQTDLSICSESSSNVMGNPPTPVSLGPDLEIPVILSSQLSSKAQVGLT